LFDNNSSPESCPHGTKERVLRATEQLHRTISPTESIKNETFEQIFKRIDKDSDGVLSCRELELFYYLYTLEVIKNSP